MRDQDVHDQIKVREKLHTGVHLVDTSVFSSSPKGFHTIIDQEACDDTDLNGFGIADEIESLAEVTQPGSNVLVCDQRSGFIMQNKTSGR